MNGDWNITLDDGTLVGTASVVYADVVTIDGVRLGQGAALKFVPSADLVAALELLKASREPVDPPVDPPTDPVPTSPPPPPPPPPPPSATADVPSVVADGQSILYHYPIDVALAAEVDHVEIPGEFGGSPETVAKIAWNFGDGTNGFGADGRHVCDKPGTYTVTGSVSYKDGRLVPFGPLVVTVP